MDFLSHKILGLHPRGKGKCFLPGKGRAMLGFGFFKDLSAMKMDWDRLECKQGDQ